MKTYRYYIMTLALSLLVAGCSEDEITKRPSANVGDEVKFGLSLPGLSTRTVYGEETSTETSTFFPIYWVNGDKVKVFSPQCLSGRNSAEYEIAVEKADQNYANSMTKTGEYGVQWGSDETAYFYSIYPSTPSTEFTVDGDNVSATLQVNATQFASTDSRTTTEGKAYYYAQPADMGNVVMYAKTTGVTKGNEVNLHYTPFSTVIEFEITAPNTYSGNQKSEITIQSLSLIAPTGTSIAGDFTFTFPTASNPNPSAAANDGGSNAITLHFLDNNQYTTVLSTTKQTLKAKMCLMPISGVSTLKDWKVEVNTSAGTFSKTIKDSDLTDKNTALAPGKVHKIKLPTLSYANTEWVYSLENWIPSLPDYRNIYLSEISLPGAWYAGSTESYQNTSKISELWTAGVRAFAVECRSWSSDGTKSPSRVCLSGSGRNAATGAYVDKVWPSATMISKIISDIASSIKTNEYGVLVLSYADGGTGGHRDSDHSYFLAGIANEITQSGATNIYTGPITAKTTVKDVLGKLIIKVNVDNQIPIGDYKGMNALISYNPFLSQMTGADFSRPYYSNLYWSDWAEGNKTYDLVANLPVSGNENKFLWVFSSANRTQTNDNGDTSIPTYAQRQTALNAMMNYSSQIYEASTHNVWFYFNCGGTQATSSDSKNPSPTDFAGTMNSWLLGEIEAKADPSPLGIVMFNQCTNASYKGPEIVKAIIEMNSKFYLKHAGTSGGSTGGNATPAAEIKSLSETHDSGMKDTGSNAISW